MRKCIVSLLLLCHLGFGAEATAPKPRRKTWWWTSVAALGAATALDVRSSWGRPEMNALLRGPDGRFAIQGLRIKSSIVAANCGFQWLVLRRRPNMDRTLAGVNSGLAAWYAVAAARNR